MLDGLVSALWNYKNKKMGEGRQLGVMAQDLEKSQLGNQMVEESKDGKKINFAKGFAAILAANADLHRRLKAVEAHA
jgi:acetyl-CoA carboxylase alpha subunit